MKKQIIKTKQPRMVKPDYSQYHFRQSEESLMGFMERLDIHCGLWLISRGLDPGWNWHGHNYLYGRMSAG